MEIEVKYALDAETAEKILEDEYLMSIEEADSRETLDMKAIYFDTEDNDFAANGIALRIRNEGEATLATLKWDGTTEGALHSRNEVNIPVFGEDLTAAPDLEILKESEIGETLSKLAEGKSLLPQVKMNVLRRKFRIEEAETLIEVSVDMGEIITSGGNAPICELELELFNGKQQVLLDISDKIAEKYDLKPEKASKYARGLELLGLKRV